MVLPKSASDVEWSNNWFLQTSVELLRTGRDNTVIKTPALRKRALNHREYSKSYRRMVGVGENSSSKDGGVRGTSSQETGERSVWRGAFVSMCGLKGRLVLRCSEPWKPELSKAQSRDRSHGSFTFRRWIRQWYVAGTEIKGRKAS